jgi:hypothetical protein
LNEVKPIVLLRQSPQVMGFAALYPSYRSNNPEMADRTAQRNSLGGGDDGVGVDAVAAVARSP